MPSHRYAPFGKTSDLGSIIPIIIIIMPRRWLLLAAVLLVIKSLLRERIGASTTFIERRDRNDHPYLRSSDRDEEHLATKVNATNSTVSFQEPRVECQDMGAMNRDLATNPKPVIVAGYPGSGNDLSRTIVERLTGLHGKDIYTENGNCSAWQRAATCKTHYPIIDTYPPDAIRGSFAPTAALLIRNPAKALPSFFNYIWEFEHSLSDHSQQGPEEEWIKWRDANFDIQIEQWYTLLVYWFENWDIQTVLPYERLTRIETGPHILQQLAQQLESSGFPTATDFECQWIRSVVLSAKVKRAPHSYTPSYTLVQKRHMIQVVQRTLTRFSDHSALAAVLQQYITSMEQHVRVVQ